MHQMATIDNVVVSDGPLVMVWIICETIRSCVNTYVLKFLKTCGYGDDNKLKRSKQIETDIDLTGFQWDASLLPTLDDDYMLLNDFCNTVPLWGDPW